MLRKFPRNFNSVHISSGHWFQRQHPKEPTKLNRARFNSIHGAARFLRRNTWTNRQFGYRFLLDWFYRVCYHVYNHWWSLCMWVCVCLCMYTTTDGSVYVCACVCVSVCVCVFVCALVCVCLTVCLCMCVFVCVYLCLNASGVRVNYFVRGRSVSGHELLILQEKQQIIDRVEFF